MVTASNSLEDAVFVHTLTDIKIEGLYYIFGQPWGNQGGANKEMNRGCDSPIVGDKRSTSHYWRDKRSDSVMNCYTALR